MLLQSVTLQHAARASAPMQKFQAPGFYRIMVGDFEVTVLSDGILPFNVHELLTNITPAQLDADLARAFLTEPVDFSVNAFLVNTGSRLALIDTGTGDAAGPAVGKLIASLEAAGYTAAQVDEIYITHMHGDHIGGLTRKGSAVFPNAVVRVAQAEADHWLSAEKMNAMPANQRDGFKAAQAIFAPYVRAQRFRPFSGDVELTPGIRALAAPGHTPGHTVYVVESRGQRLLLWGDLMHVAAAQFPDPAVTIRFDTDAAAAARQRMRLFAEAAARGDLVGGAHLPFPGLGHLRVGGPVEAAASGKAGAAAASGKGAAEDVGSTNRVSYVYVPITYSVPK
jgi:glyoxylase-like metal-dependent hydrolase (beta-lactamase superfamily II)